VRKIALAAAAALAGLVPASALAAKTGTLSSGNVKITGPIHFQAAINRKLSPFCGFSNDRRGLGITMHFRTPSAFATFGFALGKGSGTQGSAPVLHDGTYNVAHMQSNAQFFPDPGNQHSYYLVYGHGPSSVTLKNNLLSGHLTTVLYPVHETHQGPQGDPTKTPIHVVANWKCVLS
jgi:hypothetical protein